jgi:L-lactate dehydrogenase
MNERSPPSLRYPAAALVELASTLLVRTGVRGDIAHDVADVLVTGDLLGHTTHGLAQLPGYLGELDSGGMVKSGAPSIVTARPAAQTWDGGRLPGPWLTLRALEVATVMAREYGTGSVAIRRSHHIACLAAYLKRATDAGLMAIICCSDPAGASVAPFGAVTPVFTPNPIAAGIPTAGDPILLDVSASYTTNGLTGRLHKEGRQLEHPWLQDAQGNPTTDPAVLFNEPKGTLLPLGGQEAGHKGFALALLIEALTSALAGFGRADPNEGWGATVFVQTIDPDAFGGRAAFERQTQWLVDACHAATPRADVERVRLPGERALARFREQSEHGVELHPTILPAIAPWAEKLEVAMPAAR